MWAAAATMICIRVFAAFRLASMSGIYRIEAEDVPILHVAHGRRNIEELFGQ